MGSPKQSPEDIDKRTFASVTTTACTCNYLERASEEPRSPIVFDVAMQEYHIKNIGEDAGHFMVYHCPFCGGAAPKSKRASFFATITDTEWGRIAGYEPRFKASISANRARHEGREVRRNATLDLGHLYTG